MSHSSSLRHRVARGSALVCSLTLGAIVILNAQFGCDSPDGKEPKPEAAKGEAAKGEAVKVEPTKVEPAKAADPAGPEPTKIEPAAEPIATPEPEPAAKKD